MVAARVWKKEMCSIRVAPARGSLIRLAPASQGEECYSQFLLPSLTSDGLRSIIQVLVGGLSDNLGETQKLLR